MSIERSLEEDLKGAMRAKDATTVACIRAVKTKVKETTTAKGFSGEVDEALYRRVITAYVKQLRNALPELEAAGERGREIRESYLKEISYLERYLPTLLGEAETRALVEKVIADLGVSDPKRAGQVMGAVMKQHRESVDPALVKRFVDEILAGSS